MRRRRSFEDISEKLTQTVKSGSYGNTLPLINQGKVIPILSNSLYIRQLFEEEGDAAEVNPETPLENREEYETAEGSPETEPENQENHTHDQQITMAWSRFIKYPMPDKHDLARVAQYHLVEEAKEDVTSPLARKKYINFMKDFLLGFFEEAEGYSDRVRELKCVVREKNFSDLVADLGLPGLVNRTDNPLHILASLPLPFYITTSYYDFLERALIDVKKEPVTQICFWSGEPENLKPEHRTNNDIQPSPQTPMVYHLYGLEDYPETLVLSEDDYINFLITVMGYTNNSNPLVPHSLRGKLGESQLLLLGYQLWDWDFRVLFRFLLKFRQIRAKEWLEKGMVIQLKELDKKELGDEVKTIKYLEDYFKQEKFEVKRKDVELFIRDLWNEWHPEGQGE